MDIEVYILLNDTNNNAWYVVVWTTNGVISCFMASQSFKFEWSWWRLFQKRVVRTTCTIDIYGFFLNHFIIPMTPGTISILTCWQHLHDLIISADRWVFPGTKVSSTSKSDHNVHDINEISSERNCLYTHLRRSEPSFPTPTTNINHTQILYKAGVEKQMVTDRSTLSYGT